jgi:hypothetical protein
MTNITVVNLLYSAEVRWFFRGEVPADFAAWFDAGRSTPFPARTDLYLALPGCESVGVKQREGRFEVKAVIGGTVPVRYGPAVAGRSDAWVKWSNDGRGIAEWMAALGREPAGWIAVEKERRLRKFSLERGAPQEVGPDVFPHAGCNVELTRLQAQGGRWWTFGLEAYGAMEAVRGYLRLGAERFFAGEPPPMSLDVVSSCSYPAWLSALS